MGTGGTSAPATGAHRAFIRGSNTMANASNAKPIRVTKTAAKAKSPAKAETAPKAKPTAAETAAAKAAKRAAEKAAKLDRARTPVTFTLPDGTVILRAGPDAVNPATGNAYTGKHDWAVTPAILSPVDGTYDRRWIRLSQPDVNAANHGIVIGADGDGPYRATLLPATARKRGFEPLLPTGGDTDRDIRSTVDSLGAIIVAA